MLSNVQEFQEWVLFQREHYFRYLLSALQVLIKYYQDNCQLELALDYAYQQAKLAPLEESAHRQLMTLLALDGRRVMAYPYEPSDGPLESTSRPLAIGSRGLGVELKDVRVYRDVYYGCPVGPKGRWGLNNPVRVGGEEYFVLGDNSPISADSRTWPQGAAVPAELVLGKPFLVHFPARQIELGRWHFQVPDPAGIRYIR